MSIAHPGITHQVLNFLLLQGAWFTAVLGAAHGWNWPGCLSVAAVLLWHLRVVGQPRRELALIGWVTVLGLLIEILNNWLGWLQARATPVDYLPAPWLIALWSLFAASLNVTLRWLRHHRLGAALLGAIAGPAAYAAGARLDALQLVQPTQALLSLALLWALAMPLMAWLAQQLDGVTAHGQ